MVKFGMTPMDAIAVRPARRRVARPEGQIGEISRRSFAISSPWMVISGRYQALEHVRSYAGGKVFKNEQVGTEDNRARRSHKQLRRSGVRPGHATSRPQPEPPSGSKQTTDERICETTSNLGRTKRK